VSDDPAPDDFSVTARLTRIEQRLDRLEEHAATPLRLLLPAPEKKPNGRAQKST
jgi:hypothetical protein